VLYFTIGLAIATVSVGVAPAPSVSKRWSDFREFAWRASYHRGTRHVGLDAGYLGWAHWVCRPKPSSQSEAVGLRNTGFGCLAPFHNVSAVNFSLGSSRESQHQTAQ
jgi:hypothetical protein